MAAGMEGKCERKWDKRNQGTDDEGGTGIPGAVP